MNLQKSDNVDIAYIVCAFENRGSGYEDGSAFWLTPKTALVRILVN